MIEKGRSNNTSIYVLLVTAFLILAGTAYGAYSLFFNTSKDAVQTSSAVKLETKAEASSIPPKKSDSSTLTAKDEAPKQHNYSIVIEKSTFKLFVLDNNDINAPVETFSCALGKATGDKERSGDMKTPVGTFKVIEVCDASYWTHDFKDGKGEIKGAYGPWFFYLDTKEKSKGQWDGIGIHGTHDPNSIGTLASEGCIRLLNDHVQLLKTKYVKVGTLVTIKE